jgi:hypothetical protein
MPSSGRTRLDDRRTWGTVILLLAGASLVLVAKLPAAGQLDAEQQTLLLWTSLLGYVVVGIVSGWLLCTWWALLTGPGAFLVGILAASLVDSELSSGVNAPIVWEIGATIVLSAFYWAPVMLATAAGVGAAKLPKQRARRS